MEKPWNIENIYSTLWRHINLCGLCQKQENKKNKTPAKALTPPAKQE